MSKPPLVTPLARALFCVGAALTVFESLFLIFGPGPGGNVGYGYSVLGFWLGLLLIGGGFLVVGYNLWRRPHP